MTSKASPSVGDTFVEFASLLCTMAFYGPPVVFLAAPWLVLGLILSGPFTLLLTLVVALVVAAALVAGIAALIATPFLMIRNWRAAHAPIVLPTPSVQVELRQVIA